MTPPRKSNAILRRGFPGAPEAKPMEVEVEAKDSGTVIAITIPTGLIWNLELPEGWRVSQ